jgi:thermitase
MLGSRYRARAGLLLALFVSIVAGKPAQAQQTPPPFVPGRVLVQFQSGVTAAQARALLAGAGGRSVRQIAPIGVHIVQLPAQANPLAVARAFGQRREVAFAEPDYVLKPALVPNDPYYSLAWHLPKIGALTAWDTTTGSSSVTIAILDTGVDGSHPDLAPKMVPGWNVYDNNSNTSDILGHGTSVAGAAAACSNNATGVASVAWGCRIMPIRISDSNGYAYSSTIAGGITWAADHGARVANVSFKLINSSAISDAAGYLQSRGGVVTFGAGNDGSFDSSPDNPYLLMVSATDSNDALCSFTTTGNNIDLSAPGWAVTTTLRGGGYGDGTGTSFAAPVVAGVAALVISTNPGLSGAQVQDILKRSADDRGSAGWDTGYGWGRVNAARAVSLALGSGGGGGTSDTTPPTVSFSSPTAGATVSGTVFVQVSASDNVGVASVGVSLDGSTLGTDTTSPYSFTWNTMAWANGAHTLKATAIDAAGNTASATITVTVSNTLGDTDCVWQRLCLRQRGGQYRGREGGAVCRRRADFQLDCGAVHD